MTVQVGIFDAKTRLSELVQHVASSHEDVLITRRGRPVARLVPVDQEPAVEHGLARLMAARAASTPGTDSLRELIDEGRRE